MTHAAPGAPSLEAAGMRLGDELVPLQGGAVHYFRLDPAEWAGALTGVRDLGLRFVDTYVPWSVHERGPGDFDFGEYDPRLNLGRFLKLAHDLGLYVFLRPGPHINAELTGFGIPSRVLADRACQAHSSAGSPVPMVAPPQAFAVPSYASEAFHAEVQLWYRAVAKVAEPLLWPSGAVALLQVDNEAAYYFRDGPYDQDYHPDAIAHYQRLLARRYGGLDAVNDAHGTQANSLQDCEPPARFDGHSREALRRQLDWAQAREQLLEDAIKRMRDALQAEGLANLPTVHNLPLGDAGIPAGIARMQRAVDLAGVDFYECRHQLRAVKRRTLRVAGSTTLPFAPELGVGGPPWLNPRDRSDTLAVVLCSLAYGLRGFNFYMAVERDRWYGAALTRSGARTATGRQLRGLLRNLDNISFHRLTRRARVGLMVPAEYARLTRATHTLGFVSPLVVDAMGLGPEAACRQDTLGFSQPIQIEHVRWMRHAEAALDRAQIPYVYVDSLSPPERWSDLDAMLSPTYEFACPTRMGALADFESKGGLVVTGPLRPTLDTRLSPTDMPDLGGPRLDLAADAEAELAAVLPERCQPGPHWRSDLPDVETSVHGDGAVVKALFVTNFSAVNARPTVQLPSPTQLTDAISGQVYRGSQSVTLTLAPHGCRMFLVELTPAPGTPR